MTIEAGGSHEQKGFIAPKDNTDTTRGEFLKRATWATWGLAAATYLTGREEPNPAKFSLFRRAINSEHSSEQEQKELRGNLDYLEGNFPPGIFDELLQSDSDYKT